MSFELQFNIFIDPDFLLDSANKDQFTTPEQYEFDVRNVLTGINKTEVGRILFRSIKWRGRWVRVKPIGKNEDGKAYTDMNCREDTTLGYDAKLFTFYQKYKPFVNLFLPGFAPGALVKFNPDQHMTGGNCFMDHVTPKHDYEPTPESVLLHELVHAFRHMSRKFSPLETHGGLHKYDGVEEFNAILVENIFQSEVKGNIRQSHRGFHNLEKELEGSFEFFKVSTKAFEVIDRFCRESPGLTKALSKVKVPFNPIAAYYQNPGKARAMSSSETAVRRDAGALMLLPGVSWQTWLKVLQAAAP
jgi:hypothetical protein